MILSKRSLYKPHGNHKNLEQKKTKYEKEETEQIIIANHQSKKANRNTEGKKQWRYKTIRKQKINGNGKSQISIALNVNKLNSPIERHRVAVWTKKEDLYAAFRKLILAAKTGTQSDKVENDNSNGNQKKADVSHT